ncbi:MAG: DUF4097 family beta strand repeat-containing protein [bacterium]
MKKNRYWIICIASILIGSILFGIGVSLGGATSFNIGSNGLNFYNGFTNKDNQVFEIVTIDNETITKIDLDNNFSKITITNGDEISLRYSSDLEYKVKNDNTLYISSSENKQKTFGFFALFYVNDNVLEITIPESVVDVKIDSEGNVIISDLTLENLEIETSLGNVVLEDTFVTTSTIENEIGNISLTNCIIDNSKIQSSIGNVKTSNLDILSSGFFENDMGNLVLDFAKEESVYNFNVGVDLGNFEINGNKSLINYSNGTININIQSSIGNLVITTK